MEWLAQEISKEAIWDIGRFAEQRKILTLAIDESETNTRKQLRHWWISLVSEWVETESEEIDQLYSLFVDTGGWDSPQQSWPVVIEAIVRHPKVLFR